MSLSSLKHHILVVADGLDAGIKEIMFSFTVIIATLLADFRVYDHG